MDGISQVLNLGIKSKGLLLAYLLIKILFMMEQFNEQLLCILLCSLIIEKELYCPILSKGEITSRKEFHLIRTQYYMHLF